MIGFETFFFFAVILLFIGIPVIIKSVEYPASVSVVPLSSPLIPQEVQTYFHEQKSLLGERGFKPGPQFSIPEFENRNFSQLFTHEDGIVASISVIQHAEKKLSRYYNEFLTQFQDGTILITKSSPGFDMFYSPPGVYSVSYYRYEEALPLLARHEELRTFFRQTEHKPQLLADEGLLQVIEQLQKKILQYQRQRGILKEDPKSQKLKASYRMFLSIISHFMSLAEIDVDLKTKVSAFFFGFLCLFLGGIVLPVSWGTVEQSTLVHALSLGLVFVSCGFLTGRLYYRKAFPWLVLTGLFPTLYLHLTQPIFQSQIPDLFCLYVLSGLFGSRLRNYRFMKGGLDNLLVPGALVLIVFFLYVVSNR